MTPVHDKETEWLSALRDEMTPSPSDFARVRRGVTLASGALGALDSSDFADSSELAVPTRTLSTVVRSYARRLAFGSAIAAVGFGGGFLVGRTTAAQHDNRHFVSNAQPTASGKVDKLGTLGDTKSAPSPEPSVGRAVAVAPLAARNLPAPAASGPPLTIGDEARELRRADRALRTGMPSLALGILSDLEQRIPHGALLEERDAARLMARCGVQDPEALDAARVWLKQHAQSVYAARLRAACTVADSEPGL